jgi:hypothetical protein
VFISHVAVFNAACLWARACISTSKVSKAGGNLQHTPLNSELQTDPLFVNLCG